MPQTNPQNDPGAGSLAGAARYRDLLARYPLREPEPRLGPFARLLARAMRRLRRRASARGGGRTTSAAPALVVLALMAL